MNYCGIANTNDSGSITIEGGNVSVTSIQHAFRSAGSVSISGGSVIATSSNASGIYADGELTVAGGNIYFKGLDNAIRARKITINGGEVTAEGTGADSDGIYSMQGMDIQEGSVHATGAKKGIKTSMLSISDQITSLIASGEDSAFAVIVKNYVRGIGWENTAGTEGEATIAICSTFQNLSSYKKVQFPGVEKSAATVTKEPTAKTLNCNGSAQELVTAGTAEGGEMQYALGKDSATAPSDGWDTSIPTATDAGTYYVWYKVVGDENHDDAEPACVEVTIAPDYTITSVTGLSGANNNQWAKGTKDGVVITVKASGEDNSFDHFIGVKLDGKDLVKDVDYTVEKGSTIVTLKPETLEKLELGEHTVTVLFDNGEVNTALTVLEKNSENATSPKTGDNSHFGLWIALMMLSLCGIGATLLFGRKKKVFDR